MNTLVKKATLGLVLGATALSAVAVPAEAQRHRGYRGHGDAGTAIVAGIAGIAIGAALSGDRRYDYDRRYYRDHGYYPQNGYYYRNHYRNRGYESCTVRRHWDPYTRRNVMVRYC